MIFYALRENAASMSDSIRRIRLLPAPEYSFMTNKLTLAFDHKWLVPRP